MDLGQFRNLGTAMYIRKNIKYNVIILKELFNETIIELEIGKLSFKIATMYRQPKYGNFKDYLNELDVS